tara:strand:+ start:3035 stop:3913 length:879 start_codon:yes stop_codon:yes gene_type:complete
MKKDKSKSLFTSILTSSTSVVISLSLVLFFIGMLALVLINAQKLSNYVKENIGFTIMLQDNSSEIETLEIQKLLDASNFVKQTVFISKEEATKELEKELGEDFVDFLGYSPLLASIDVKLNALYANSDSLRIIDAELRKNDIVHDVYYQENIVDKINSNANRISVFLLGFSGLLFILSFVLINNTIRLSIYSKRFLVRTMSLVGAKNSFIKKPFLANSMYQGMYGAIFAIFMLIGSIHLIQSETAKILNINDLQIIAFVFILIFIFGLLISWLSTYFAVKKYLNLKENDLYN